MTPYGLKQIVLFAAVGVCLMLLNPSYFWVVFLVVVGAWAVLTGFQAKSYRHAVRQGFLKASQDAGQTRTAFFIARDCPNAWAVKRHIRMFF